MVNSNNSISKEDLSNSTEEKVRAEKKDSQKSSGKDEDVGFNELYEQSLRSVQLGQIVTGKVVQINTDVVMVDVGWKTEGYIPAKELRDEDGNIPVAVGDEIEVLVDRRDGDGNLVLSRDKAIKIKVWDDVKNACEHNTHLKGTVVERVKGGFSVDIGILAFLPGSQVDVRPVRDLDRFVGQTLMFNVLKYDRKRNNVVLSRRSIMEQERVAAKKETMGNIEEAKIMEGVIKNITDYGLFIDLGGIDGLLHVTDISWGRITRPSDNFTKGERIWVKVLSFDRGKERVSLGLKQLTDNPWEMIEKKYPVGSVIEGKVVNLTDYGVFVEMEPGVEGLVHITEMFWTREIKHPSKVLSVGEMVKVMVLDVNPELKRISLGLKQTTENPWEALKQKYPEGSIVRGVIRNITNFGFFVSIEEGIDGLVHVSDISWKLNVKHPSEFYKKGQEVEAMVLNIDVANKKFSLGIKQVDQNPWDEKNFSYAAGSVISGKVTNVTDFGIFVELEEGVEGLVHISELSHKRVEAASEIYSVGDVVSAIVKSVDLQNKRIRLSIKDYESATEGTSSVTQYLNNKENVGSNLGKVLADVKMAENDKG